jgi:prefoldin subunit 5
MDAMRSELKMTPNQVIAAINAVSEERKLLARKVEDCGKRISSLREALQEIERLHEQKDKVPCMCVLCVVARTALLAL